MTPYYCSIWLPLINDIETINKIIIIVGIIHNKLINIIQAFLGCIITPPIDNFLILPPNIINTYHSLLVLNFKTPNTKIVKKKIKIMLAQDNLV